jgi:hypothetical protein
MGMQSEDCALCIETLFVRHRMFGKYRQPFVGAWHSAKKFSDLPKNGRPNATPLHSDVTFTTF